jgi:hypothetical protein
VFDRVSRLPKARGLLPHFVTRRLGEYRICANTEYSTIDASLYYHAMLLAAQVLGDAETGARLAAEIRGIDFAGLRDAKGRILHGLKEDGVTQLGWTWGDWGGETALVLLLERMAAGDRATLKMEKTGKVLEGRGFIQEIQSLFYPQFSETRADAITGANWLDARRRLLQDQMNYFPRDSAAAEMGVYGLSAGEGPDGVGYASYGTEVPNARLIHPHYMLMSGVLRRDPETLYRTLQAMEARGLLPPWGLVENATPDLSSVLPMIGSLNAAFECLGAYHLYAQVTGTTDCIFEAARNCEMTREAIRIFYP